MVVNDVFGDIPVLSCVPNDLNNGEVAKFATCCDADLTFIFGPDLIFDPLFSALPELKINMHLGLSPWYRGSATLFWPFYNLEPQKAGATFHQIVPEADAGKIFHQCCPSLCKGDGIHDVGAKTVLQAAREVVNLLKVYSEDGSLEAREQKSTGRLYLSTQFRPAHLRVIYDLFDNKVVDQWH